MRSKELRLVEQGLSKLKAKEAKKDSSQEDAETAYPLTRLRPTRGGPCANTRIKSTRIVTEP